MRVTDRLIRSVVRDGAQSCDDVAELCGAGACCGGCRPAVDEIVREERRAKDLVLLSLRPVGTSASRGA
jgi:bacterioferritin-associated ferredoxin